MTKHENYIIETKNLSFSFGKFKVLNKISLHVPQGSIYGFLGPNGAGKTTTIKILLSLLKIKSHKAYLFGKDITGWRLYTLERTGAMVEMPSLYDHLTGYENVEITRILRGLDKKRTDEVLKIVHMTRDAQRFVRHYSTGMKQRLSLAAALLSEPELLILDEPINGLDPGGIIEIRNLLIKLNQTRGITIFLSSHILSEIEKLCTHVAIINKGNLLYQGTMEELQQKKTSINRLNIETDDNEKAAGILRKEYTVVPGENNLICEYKAKDESANIIRLLVENGLAVYQAKIEVTDLEDSFLSIINQ